MDWFDLLAVQGTLKNLQYHSSKASILQRSAFFIIQLSHPYLIAGKAIALTKWTFVSKLMSLLFNTLSRFVIAFLPTDPLLPNLYANTHFTDIVVFQFKSCRCVFSSLFFYLILLCVQLEMLSGASNRRYNSNLIISCNKSTNSPVPGLAQFRGHQGPRIAFFLSYCLSTSASYLRAVD